MGDDIQTALYAELLQSQLDLLETELRRRRWLDYPECWIQERLGEFLWSKQREVAQSVRWNRRTAVHSCHEAGKSWLAARLVGWWLDTHPPGSAFVITSATTGDQVKGILWSEIGQLYAKGALPGRLNQTEWWMDVVQANGRSQPLLVAVGRKPSEYNPTAFQGYHRRYMLVIFDEACGIPGGTSDNYHSLWEAADSLIANEDSRFLAIGNPDDPQSEFANVCKPGSGWNVIGIDAFDTPNFTGEEVPNQLRYLLIGRVWEEEKRKKWGETNPLYISKVRGRFPELTTDNLIPMKWIRDAQLRDLVRETPEDAKKLWPHELGVDVGAGGEGKNTVAERRGPVVRIVRRDRQPDTMVSCGNLIRDLRSTGATRAKVDYIGVGKGLVDRAKEIGAPVIGVNVSLPPKHPEEFENIRAEGYWIVRERFGAGDIDIDPQDDDLAAQLADIKVEPSSRGRLKVESKEQMRRRGRASPDDADAVMLSLLPDTLLGPSPVVQRKILLG